MEPEDWKPPAIVGAGVREIRMREGSGAYRVIYLASLRDAIDVLRAFQKKTRRTAQWGSPWRGDSRVGSEALMAKRTFKSVCDALETDAESAANVRLRSELMMALRSRVEACNAAQAKAAKRLHVTQPRLNDLLRGRIDKFSLDALVALAEPAGLKIDLRIRAAA
jgi:predicted XRE-type DNA-binding protein